MNIKMLNTINLDDVIIKKGGSGGGGGVQINNQDKDITVFSDSTTEIVADSGYTGLGKVTVTAKSNNQDKVIDIAENGTTEVIADEDFTGLGKVTVNVEVASSGGGGSNTQENDVTFYDYDGTILHSYTKKDFLALTEFPELPAQKGLICEGWNNNIDEAQSYVREYGFLQVGATYVTDDGKTRLYISTAKGRMNIPLNFIQDVANGVIVDWGDGSSTQTFSNTGSVGTSHTYSKIGDYIISLEPINNCTLKIGKNSYNVGAFGSTSDIKMYLGMLKKVEIGNNVSDIGDYAFQQCRNLRSITIPNNTRYISKYTFESCVNLQNVVLPYEVTIRENAFQYCSKLQNAVMFKSYLSQYCFLGCSKLKHIVLPPIKNVNVPQSSFYNTGLQNVIITNEITEIGKSAFRNTKIQNLVIPNNVRQIGEQAFEDCSLESVVISENVVQISNYIFQNCKNLQSVTIPNSVTSIGSSAFESCISLYNITIPKSVTNIGGSAFKSSSLGLIDFSQHESIPTLGSSVFTSVYNYNIIVPDVLYDEWIAATNWSNYASKIIKKSDYDAL